MGAVSNEDYSLQWDAGRATVIGIMRLASPDSYEQVFAGIRSSISAAEAGFVVDISEVRFMNSSGITALSRLVLLARKHGHPLLIIGSKSISWQTKTLSSLQRLYGKLNVDLC